MRSAFLEDARPESVSHAIRHVLERRGSLVREHVSTRVRFDARPADGGWSWTRSGYVGLYQRLGEKDVEMRLILRARWPHRLFWGTAALVLLACVLTFILNPSGTVWFVVALLGAAALLVTTLLYLNTWRPVREEERAIMEAFEAELRADHVAAALRGEEEREALSLEAELEGEVARRHSTREARAQKAEAKAAPKAPRSKPRFNLAVPKLGRSKAPPPGSPEEDEAAKRARLEALRAEVEKRKQDGQ